MPLCHPSVPSNRLTSQAYRLLLRLGCPYSYFPRQLLGCTMPWILRYGVLFLEKIPPIPPPATLFSPASGVRVGPRDADGGVCEKRADP